MQSRARHFVVSCIFILMAQNAIAETTVLHQSQLDSLHTKIVRLKNTIAVNQQQQSNLQQRLKMAELANGKLSEQILKITHELNQQKIKLSELNTTQKMTQTRLNSQNTALAEQLRAAYKLGTQNQLKILLNQEDMSTANRHLTYYKTLNETRAKLIVDIQQNLQLLTKTIQDSELHERALKKLLAEKERQQTKQAHILRLRQQLITQLGLQTESKQAQIESLLANQKTLQDTVIRLKQREFFTTDQSFDQLKTKLMWPVKGNFVSSYGSLLDVGTQRSNGVLIQTPMGSPVHAIYSGKIIFADWLRGFGLLVIINHGHQYLSLYARNQAIYAKTGQYVRTGDVISSSGNSGGYQKPGLYFEIREKGLAVNPKIWCR